MFFWSFGNTEKGISGSELTKASTKASRNVDNEMNSRHQQNVSFNGYSNEETLNVNKTS